MEAVNQSEEFRMKMQSNKQHHIDTNPESKGILLANRTLIIPTADDELLKLSRTPIFFVNVVFFDNIVEKR